ncbi:hypothetical protein PLEOSDRAFT_1110053 [Pleurotus ostreatus PC15]|uniref:Uncharacterized protein n=1 Tax=Pleurotus ostreatus (strain PC15) TaxID=1137138 RepID=A0A067N7M3_PLEO1|nr:hypothetical protein PLEOSDRAFT_1110053 [Pleurotus ostreatus PC15]
MLATEKDADEVAPPAVYDEHDVAHIAVTYAFSVGTATVLLKERWYSPHPKVDVRFCVEFANSEECTRFLHEDMRRFTLLIVSGEDTDIAVIDDIMDALFSIHGDHWSAEKNAVRRGIPFSQFQDEYPEPETQLIRHRGHDRPCYLTLSISLSLSCIERVDWSATTIPPTVPSPCGSFQSLNNLHLKFPSHSSQQDDLTITISAREISFLDGANSVSAGNSFSVNSVHRTVTVNYINNIGDAFLAPIYGGNNGGRNNTNTSSPHLHHTRQLNTPELKFCYWLGLWLADSLNLNLSRLRRQSHPRQYVEPVARSKHVHNEQGHIDIRAGSLEAIRHPVTQTESS